VPLPGLVLWMIMIRRQEGGPHLGAAWVEGRMRTRTCQTSCHQQHQRQASLSQVQWASRRKARPRVGGGDAQPCIYSASVITAVTVTCATLCESCMHLHLSSCRELSGSIEGRQ
jgi:hypothetical protein